MPKIHFDFTVSAEEADFILSTLREAQRKAEEAARLDYRDVEWFAKHAEFIKTLISKMTNEDPTKN